MSRLSVRCSTIAVISRACRWCGIIPCTKATSASVCIGAVMPDASSSDSVRLLPLGPPSCTTGASSPDSSDGSDVQPTRTGAQSTAASTRRTNLIEDFSLGARIVRKSALAGQAATLLGCSIVRSNRAANTPLAAPGDKGRVSSRGAVMAAQRNPGTPTSRSRRWVVLAVAVLVATLAPVSASAADDPRVGLAPGYFPWTEASSNIELLDNDPRVAPFDAAPGNFGFVNSDLAFTGTHAIVGSFNGFQVYDVSDPADPELAGSFVCPGGQGDVSVFGDLLFMSVEENRGRIDCAPGGANGGISLERFRGVRIFDISDLSNPVQ